MGSQSRKKASSGAMAMTSFGGIEITPHHAGWQHTSSYKLLPAHQSRPFPISIKPAKPFQVRYQDVRGFRSLGSSRFNQP
jgi:hypothetical protein